MLNVSWIRTGLKAREDPDSKYPNGVEVDVVRGQKHSCSTELPYPAKGIGYYLVECDRCGLRVGITTAGRCDDPRSLRVPCKPRN